jgi:glycosyltransferase involved in cell wall biosynthesis
MPFLTIYTPTYNRSHFLKRLYNSLKTQTCFDFLWLVVDDGSTDDTHSLIDSFASNDNHFEIQYVYKNNQGVHSAREVAYSLCDTELIMSVDSDDWLVIDAVESIRNAWQTIKGKENVAGIFSLNINCKNDSVEETFPQKPSFLSFQELTFKYKFRGDKCTIVRSKIIKDTTPAPCFDGEKVIGENYKWIQIPNYYKFYLLKRGIKYVEYLSTGISSQNRNFYDNPNGFREYYRNYIIFSVYFKQKIKGHIGFIASSLWLKKSAIKDSPKPFASFLIFPIGLIYFLVKKSRL